MEISKIKTGKKSANLPLYTIYVDATSEQTQMTSVDLKEYDVNDFVKTITSLDSTKQDALFQKNFEHVTKVNTNNKSSLSIQRTSFAWHTNFFPSIIIGDTKNQQQKKHVDDFILNNLGMQVGMLKNIYYLINGDR